MLAVGRIQASDHAVPAVVSGRVVRSVVLDRAGSFEVLEQDRLDVEDELDLVADDHPAAGELVLPGDAEVVAVDRGARLEADTAQVALVLVTDPERRLPLPEGGDVERDGSRDAADRELDLALEGCAASALGEAPGEGDLGVILDVEEVAAAEVLVALLLAGPDPGGVDLPSKVASRQRSQSNSSRPWMSLNSPRTQLTIMCRARNSASVWPGSKIQVAISDTPF